MNSKRRSGFQNDTRAYFGFRGPTYLSYSKPFLYNPNLNLLTASNFYLRYY